MHAFLRNKFSKRTLNLAKQGSIPDKGSQELHLGFLQLQLHHRPVQHIKYKQRNKLYQQNQKITGILATEIFKAYPHSLLI